MMPISSARVLFDFTQPDAKPWLPIDDRVMGGVSHSEMRVEDGKALFAGVVSLELGGGFASVRSMPGLWDLGAYAGIEASLCGDGRRYKLRLKSDPGFDGINWQGEFQTRRGERQVVRISFQDFVPVYRGSRVSNPPPLDLRSIRSFGLLISDKQAGPFRLEIEQIAAYC